MSADTWVIGVDLATDACKVGAALLCVDAGEARLLQARACSNLDSPSQVISAWMQAAPGRVLLAIDAPLGWPTDMGPTLSAHRAGQPIQAAPSMLFRRETDRVVRVRLKKTPLDVGADRIARTALAAVTLLQRLSSTVGPVPLAWRHDFEGSAAIEVYPAATLICRGWRSSGYKAPEQQQERRELISRLTALLSFECDSAPLAQSADVLDAVLCTVAGLDFLAGRCVLPEDSDLAKKEGWIWFAQSSASNERPGASSQREHGVPRDVS